MENAGYQEKILFTLLMLLVYRIGAYIPVPGVNVEFIANQVADYDVLGFLNLFSGGALGNMTIFALGIVPYINASIIMNLLTVAILKLERMAKEGDDGRKKIASITRYLGVILGLVQAIGILLGFGSQAVQNPDNPFDYITIIICLTAGTALIMWIGERITEKGIGNGISLLIFISIISRVPAMIQDIITKVELGTITFWSVLIVAALAFVIILGITFVDLGERRIPVQYAKRVVGRKMYGGQSTHIPMKVNQSGVMPLIFAVTILMLPGMIGQFWPESGFYQWYLQYAGPDTWIYAVVYALLILFFSYFYSQIAFNPVDVSKNLQQNGGFIRVSVRASQRPTTSPRFSRGSRFSSDFPCGRGCGSDVCYRPYRGRQRIRRNEPAHYGQRGARNDEAARGTDDDEALQRILNLSKWRAQCRAWSGSVHV